MENLGCRHVAVILVNYCGWRDTIECLESLYLGAHANFTVIVVDNASPDASANELEHWAFDHCATGKTSGPRHVQSVATDGPDYRLIRAAGDPALTPRLILIRHSANGGFAAANNLAVRFALLREAPDYFWFLNNDTVVAPDALPSLLSHSVGRVIVGARLMEYSDRERLQTWGGGRLWPLVGHNRNTTVPASRLDYLTGASIFLSRDALRQIGDWDERYFLLWEDIEFSQRALARGYHLVVADDAMVYHKGTVSIGRRSELDVYQRTLNGLRYIARHHPVCLPTTFAAYLLKFPRSLLLRSPDYLRAVARAFRDFLLRR